MTSSLLTLICALGVARDEILEAIVAHPTILRFLFRLVAIDFVPQALFEEALSCLMTLTEDNLPLGQAIIDDQETRCYDELLKLAGSSSSSPRAVLACGVLHNVFSSLEWLDHSPGKNGACDAILVPSLTDALGQPRPPNGDASAHAQIIQIALEILASIGTDLQTALEKGSRPQPGAKAGAVKADDEWNGIEDDDAMDVDGGDGDEDEEEEDDKEEDEDDDDDDSLGDLEEDMERVTGVDDDDAASDGELDDLPTLRELVQTAVPRLVHLTQIAVHNDDDLAIQSHALSALNNIAWTVSCIDFTDGDNGNIFRAWAPKAKKIWQQAIAPILEADRADLQLATQVTSLAWAVSRSLNGTTPIGKNDHRKFISLYQASRGQQQPTPQQAEGEEKEDPFQGLGVKCIGVLGSLARDPAPASVNREVGVFFMTLLNSAESVPAADVIETLNQVFDIYGDEEFACDKEVFWKDGFLSHLEALLPRLKTIAKGIDKRAFEELRVKADEAIVNLGRFIQYKKKHAPKA